jgi:protein-S-isoprenylcysteine O-methyltransferase Ste14
MTHLNFISVCWLLLVLVWILSAFSIKPTNERQHWGGRLATVSFLTLTFLLLAGKVSLWGITERIWPVGRLVWILGCVITCAGLVVSIWSRMSLGTNWSATVTYREGHELIMRGPYRFLRHPMYTGLLLMIAGTVVVVGSISGVVSLIICFLGTWWKLKKEEALLTKHFPDGYPRYKLQTKALIPFIF